MEKVIALLTNKTYLMHKNAEGKWEDFISITKYPQIGGEPEQVEVTRLCDTKKRFINGIQDTDKLQFEANYNKEDYAKLNAIALSDKLETYRLCFGDMLGTDGCWEWSGKLSVFISEGEVNGARKMTFTISDEGATEISEVDALTEAELAA